MGALPTDAAAEQLHRGHKPVSQEAIQGQETLVGGHIQNLRQEGPEDAPSSWSKAAGFQKGGPGWGEFAETVGNRQHGAQAAGLPDAPTALVGTLVLGDGCVYPRWGRVKGVGVLMKWHKVHFGTSSCPIWQG